LSFLLVEIGFGFGLWLGFGFGVGFPFLLFSPIFFIDANC
jgi:hypothetical protein